MNPWSRTTRLLLWQVVEGHEFLLGGRVGTVVQDCEETIEVRYGGAGLDHEWLPRNTPVEIPHGPTKVTE